MEGAYDPDNPPPSTVVISLGTDTTDLVITNGYRVWQRSIPIGGNHFTKALTKELKLTFAKAEHLKRNAMKAENPKAVFQAMRPVFSDLVAEIQRSIGFFTSNNRNAKLGDDDRAGQPDEAARPAAVPVAESRSGSEAQIDEFNDAGGRQRHGGAAVQRESCSRSAWRTGLCVQALDKAQLRTNLLPEEIVTTRLVKAKKPWAVAAAALLLAGMTINYFEPLFVVAERGGRRYDPADGHGAAGAQHADRRIGRDGFGPNGRSPTQVRRHRHHGARTW